MKHSSVDSFVWRIHNKIFMDFAIENNILIGLTGMSRLIYHDEKSLSSTKFHYCRRSILILKIILLTEWIGHIRPSIFSDNELNRAIQEGEINLR